MLLIRSLHRTLFILRTWALRSAGKQYVLCSLYLLRSILPPLSLSLHLSHRYTPLLLGLSDRVLRPVGHLFVLLLAAALFGPCRATYLRSNVSLSIPSLSSSSSHSYVIRLACVCWTGHYIKRELETLYIHRFVPPFSHSLLFVCVFPLLITIIQTDLATARCRCVMCSKTAAITGDSARWWDIVSIIPIMSILSH